MAETPPCFPSGPDTAELAPGASACRTHPRSVLTNSWGCRGTWGTSDAFFGSRVCSPPLCVHSKVTRVCPPKGPERPIPGQLGIGTLVFGKACLCKARPTSALSLCLLELSTPSTGEPTEQGRQEGRTPPAAHSCVCAHTDGRPSARA